MENIATRRCLQTILGYLSLVVWLSYLASLSDKCSSFYHK